MNWVAASFASLCFFVLSQIFIKQNGRAGVPSPVINFIGFAINALIFLFVGGMAHFSQFSLSVWAAFFIAAIFIYIGNAASVRGFNRAPNPGYSMAITKSHVVTDAIASILLFGGQLAWQKISGVVLIVASQLLVVGKGSDNKASNGLPWARFSFVALFSYSILAIVVKYAYDNLGISQTIFLFWSILIAVAFFGSELFFKRITLLNYKKQTWSLVLAGLGSGLGNIFMWDALVNAPNMGYVTAINITSAAIISILSVKIFKTELNWKKMAGIVGISFGILLIIFT